MSRRDRLILLGTLLCAAVLPLGDLWHSGVAGAVRYSAADSFYYHTVARNLASFGRISFDQRHPTNGFHPLWQALLALLYFVCWLLGLSDGSYLTASILLSLGLVTASLYLAARAFLAAKGRLSAWLLICPVGAYGLLLAPFWYVSMQRGLAANSIEGPPQLYGSLWSFMNGMESALGLLGFAGLAWRFSRSGPRSALVDGLLLALVTLARLDVVFITAALGAWLGLGELKRGAARNAVAAGVGFAAPIAVYLVFNRIYAHSWLPVSGTTKSSFPHFNVENWRLAAATGLHFPASVDAFFHCWRLGQMIVPALFAVVVAPLLLGFGADRLDRFLAVAAAGVIGLGAYNFCFVPTWAQGHWYYAVSISWMSLAAVAVLQRIRWSWRPPIVVVVAVFTLLNAGVFFGLFRRPECHAEQASLLARAAEVRARYPLGAKLLEYDDGIIAFATGFRCMNAFGLAVDRQAAEALRAGRLASLAYDRGFTRVAVFSYSPFDFSTATADQIAAFIPSLRLGDELDVKLEYALPGTRFAILRMERKEQ